ncbi:ATP-binding protein [Methylobacterium sp. J-030]|uniref:AAA family ATPase n=1 Tax=Methylobacterium sp. J-030 TaxID=2836627 RepID=UPI001FB9043E|nr:AAA family ATPase [Methylobacterium sp. J-030]MCJ2069957.1 ATP-binding protein [Methylobacterium sp. J-030]
MIDPDAFLETEGRRVWTLERNAEAWHQAFTVLRGGLEAGTVERVVVVCVLQGAGKSTWVAQREPEAGTVHFDAALPGARHRAPIIALARSCNIPVAAVWIRAPLALALERNRQRPADRRVPEASIHSVDRLFEPPTTDEGFAAVRIVEG